MELSPRIQRLLVLILICLHAILRFPTNSRAGGTSDSYFIVGMSHTLIREGSMPWIDNIFSYPGLYPFSYPSGGPVCLSTIWEVTGLGPDWTSYFFNLIFSYVGLMGVFMLATTVKREFMVGFAAAFAFSFSPVIFSYTYWTQSTRGLFVCLLPIFVWLLFRTLSRRHGARYGLIAAIIFPIMMSIHHMGLFLPVLVFGYILAHITSVGMDRLRFTSIYSREVSRAFSVIVLAFFVFLLILQTLMDSFYSPDLVDFKFWYLKEEGNPFVTILNIGIFYTVSVGVLMLCGVFGFARLIENTNKSGPEWGILFMLLVFAYFLADQLYLIVFLTPLIMPVIGYGIYEIVSRIETKPGFAFAIFTAILLTAVPHATYSANNFKNSRNVEFGFPRWGLENMISASIYVGQELDSPYICNYLNWARRMSAYSGQPGMPLEVTEYPVLDEDAFDRIESERVGLVEFYLDSDTRKDEDLWQYSWIDENDSYQRRYLNIVKYHVRDPRGRENLSAMGIHVGVVSGYFPEEVGNAKAYYSLRFSWFFASLPDERYRMYDNGHEMIYQL